MDNIIVEAREAMAQATKVLEYIQAKYPDVLQDALDAVERIELAKLNAFKNGQGKEK